MGVEELALRGALLPECRDPPSPPLQDRDFFTDNLLVRIHLIIVMFGGPASRHGSLNSLFQEARIKTSHRAYRRRLFWQVARLRRISGASGLWYLYRGTSLTRKRTPPGPYRRPMPKVLGWS